MNWEKVNKALTKVLYACLVALTVTLPLTSHPMRISTGLPPRVSCPGYPQQYQFRRCPPYPYIPPLSPRPAQVNAGKEKTMLHVLLDLYECHPDLLTNEARLRQVLEDLPDRIGMKRVGPVELRYITTSTPLDDGYSGFTMIATSHCSLHAWAPYGMVNIDVFSCEDFSEADVVAFVKERFATEQIEVHTIQRAVRSPRPSARAASSPSLAPIQAAQSPC